MNKIRHNFKVLSSNWMRAMCFALLTMVSLGLSTQVANATTCAGAQVIAAAPALPLTLTNACSGANDITSANSTTCGSANYKGGQEAVYVWTPTGSYTGVTVASSGQTWSGITFYAGCPTSGGICLGSVTSSAAAKTLTVPGTINGGTTYYIVIDTWPTPNSACPGTIVLNGTLQAPCSTPAPGNTLATVSAACTGAATTLSLQNATVGNGVTYAWESADDNLFTVNVATLPSTANTQATTIPATPTYYRCAVTCATGPVTVYSDPILLSAAGPSASNTVASVGGACVGAPFNLSLSAPQTGLGYTYQWESAADTDPTFATPTALGTAATQTIASQTAASYYRCTISCAALGLSVVSTPILVTQNLPSGCYCTPVYTSGTPDGDLISNVVISGTTLSNPSGTTVGTPSWVQYIPPTYTAANYTANLIAGNTYNVTVTIGAFTNQGVKAWIDYNDDGFFAASEAIGSTTSAIFTAFGTATFPITVACNPPTGVHRMRIRDVYAQSGPGIDPCASYGWGETEDYLVTIDAALPCPAPSNMTATATAGGANLAWVAGCVETDWDVHVTTVGGGAPTGAASNPGVTATTLAVSGLDPNTAYEVWYRADCDNSSGGGQSTWVGPVNFTTLPTCFEPTTLVASNITSSDAEINFTAPVSGTPAGYEYYVSTSATAPTNATAGTAISGPGATQTTLGNALTPNTLHYVWVRSTCGIMPISGNPNNSAWSFSTSFTTLDVPCAGTPTPGNISPSSACAGSTVTLSLQNPTSGTGVTYQWFDGAGNPIAGATNATYTTPAIVGGEEFYCEVTCANGPATGTSNTVTIALNPFNQCYCSSIPSQSADEEIFGVSMTSTTGTVSQASDCTTTAPGAGSINQRYSNYTGNTPLVAVAGTVVNFSIDLNSCGGTFNNGTAIFIDLNQDGDYSDIDEKVFVEPVTVSTPVGTGRVLAGSFTLPLTATVGTTGMRIINAEGYAGATLTPCLAYGYGETEDYLITIDPSPLCSGTPAPGATVASANPFCQGASTTLSLGTPVGGTGITYQWFDGAGAISGANASTYSATVAGTYYCEATCSNGGAVGSSTPLAVTVTAATGTSLANPIVVGQAPCTSSPYVNVQTNTTANCFSDNTPSNFGSSPDVWYQFTLASAATVELSLCGSGFDTYISLHDNTGALISGNDDNGPLCSGAESSISTALAAGTYYVVSQGYGANTGAITTSIKTTDACSTVLPFNALIQGYIVPSSNPPVMQSVALNQGVSGATASDCDVLTVELRSTTSNGTEYPVVASTTTATLDVNGVGSATFASAVPAGSYYVVLKHRNSIETWSAAGVTIPAATPYNFTSAATQAFGDNMVEFEGTGIFAIYNGDFDGGAGAGAVEGSDFALWEADANDFASGYLSSDLDGAGSPDGIDFSIWELNSNNFVGAITPTP